MPSSIPPFFKWNHRELYKTKMRWLLAWTYCDYTSSFFSVRCSCTEWGGGSDLSSWSPLLAAGTPLSSSSWAALPEEQTTQLLDLVPHQLALLGVLGAVPVFLAVPRLPGIRGHFVALVEGHGHGVPQSHGCCGRRAPFTCYKAFLY